MTQQLEIESDNLTLWGVGMMAVVVLGMVLGLAIGWLKPGPSGDYVCAERATADGVVFMCEAVR